MNQSTAPHRVATPLDLLHELSTPARLTLLAVMLLLFLLALFLGIYSVPETATTSALPSAFA